jgi:predicted PurR-regulated permease PerM
MTVDAVRPLENRLHAAQIQVRAIDIITNILSNIPKPDPSLIIGRMTDVAMSTMTWGFYGLSIMVLSFYFLLDGHNIKEAIVRAFPRKYYVSLMMLASEMDLTLQAFFHGQIVLGLLFGGIMLLIYALLGIHYALVLGVFLGAWEIVPVIGPTIGFIPTIVTVAIDGMDAVHLHRGWQILLVIVITQVLQWLKDNIVAPRYIGNVIGLHPVLIFIAIMLGARLDGMAGIICSLPAACVINVLISHQVARAIAAKRAASYIQVGAIESNAAAASLARELEAA